jgi:hypothetical protein
MSLLRLLTTGKSLVGLKNLESRYRLTTQRLLPQFGPTRNPFRSNGKSEPAQTEALVPGNDVGRDPSAEVRLSADACGAARSTPLRGEQDRAVSTSVGGGRFTEALRTRAAALLGGYQAKLSGMIRRVRVKAAKPAIPRFTKPPVQGELSLDKIRVMRNDLSDADLEVIATRVPTTPASSGPAVKADKAVGIAESGCRRATAGVLGAGKS